MSQTSPPVHVNLYPHHASLSTGSCLHGLETSTTLMTPSASPAELLLLFSLVKSVTGRKCLEKVITCLNDE
jgi:hypothetical protein